MMYADSDVTSCVPVLLISISHTFHVKEIKGREEGMESGERWESGRKGERGKSQTRSDVTSRWPIKEGGWRSEYNN